MYRGGGCVCGGGRGVWGWRGCVGAEGVCGGGGDVWGWRAALLLQLVLSAVRVDLVG